MNEGNQTIQLDKLVIDVITGKLERFPEGVPFSEILPEVTNEAADTDTPVRDGQQVFDMLQALLIEGMVTTVPATDKHPILYKPIDLEAYRPTDIATVAQPDDIKDAIEESQEMIDEEG